MKKFTFLVCLIALTAMFVGQAHAFDGERKGFMLNLGAGMGQGKLEISDSRNSDSLDGTGFSTDFKIGAGLSPNAFLYYTNRVIWWSDQKVSFNTGMSAVGFSYSFSPQTPSFFLSGSVGIGVARDEDSNSETGTGFGFGAGFEFSKNWTVEASYLSANVGDESGVDITASNLAVTVSWFAY